MGNLEIKGPNVDIVQFDGGPETKTSGWLTPKGSDHFQFTHDRQKGRHVVTILESEDRIPPFAGASTPQSRFELKPGDSPITIGDYTLTHKPSIRVGIR
ncbi:hypothetical protein ACFL2C_02825 [Patescibacteria group bacterium]